MANIAYIRVSTVEQNEEQQLIVLNTYKIDKVFQEKVSAKDTNRPQLQAMLNYIREGDTLYVHDFSRLARLTVDLLNIVELFKPKCVRLVSLKENIDTNTPIGKLILHMIAAINEFECDNLLERQREGIRCAKKRGAYKGRKRIEVDSETFERLYILWDKHQISKNQIANKLNVSRTVVDRLFRERLK